MAASLSSTSVLGTLKTELNKLRKRRLSRHFFVKKFGRGHQVKTVSRIALPVRQRFLKKYSIMQLSGCPDPHSIRDPLALSQYRVAWVAGAGGCGRASHIVDPNRQGRGAAEFASAQWPIIVKPTQAVVIRSRLNPENQAPGPLVVPFCRRYPAAPGLGAWPCRWIASLRRKR